MEPESSKSVAPNWALEPSRAEVLSLATACYLIYVGLVAVLDNYWILIKSFGDNQPYVEIATAIRHWDIASIHAWQFFGLPYGMVAFSFLTRTSLLTALLVISIVGSCVAILMAYRLWGGWVAGFFAIANREWMERSLLGGAEPLFLALVFGSFLAVRRQRWLLATLLASFSTVVRPMGIFALAAIGLVLLFQKEYKTLAVACLIGIFIGALYVVPLRVYLGSGLANVREYGEEDGSGGRVLTYPFVALMRRPTAWTSPTSTQDVNAGKTTKLNLARSALWIGVVLLGVAAMVGSRQFRGWARNNPVEIVFCGLYTGLLFTYNSPWARAAFPRYAIPIIPFVILALAPWIPKDRRLLWGFGVLSAALSAAETVGVLNAIEAVRKLL